jgi:type VII secretion protein EccB
VASKRDQLQAYQFVVQRAVSALVLRETDPEQPPFRRPAGASFGSVAVAVIALACVAVYGLIVPGGDTAWRREPGVIVEKETGTRYVYLDGKLHPVTNYASALLLLGDHRATQSVSRDSLVGVPRGPRIGIPDAPDALPGPDRLLTGSWSLCSTPASDVAGGRVEQSVLLAGTASGGGSALADRALLVQLASTGDHYLVWRGHRHRITDWGAVGTGLSLTGEPWAVVGPAWLDVLPEGAPVGPLAVSNPGAPSGAVPGRTDIRVGALLVVQTSGGGQQFYLAEADALRPISGFQYDIQRAYAPNLPAYPDGEPIAVPLAPPSAAAARRLDPVAATPEAAPAARPEIARLRDREATVCAVFEPGAAVPHLTVDPTLPATDPSAATARRTDTGAPLADRVYLPPGWAALVEAMPAPDAPRGTLTVVTDLGRRYALATPEVQRMLGYGGAHPVRLPAGLVARLPEGPGLDPAAATRQPAG